jgi:hypothetical protein
MCLVSFGVGLITWAEEALVCVCFLSRPTREKDIAESSGLL